MHIATSLPKHCFCSTGMIRKDLLSPAPHNLRENMTLMTDEVCEVAFETRYVCMQSCCDRRSAVTCHDSPTNSIQVETVGCQTEMELSSQKAATLNVNMQTSTDLVSSARVSSPVCQE